MWDEVQFPNFITEIHPHSRQPINTALRDKNGTIYLSSDGAGGKSVLWVSKDNGKTWSDPVGRSGGRHTTFALLSDGKTIIGMGGKNTDIDGYMPKSISKDGGKTWEVVKTRFPAQGSNQRPIIIRLQSGRLFFAADFQHISGRKPDDITQSGSFVALSDDDGENWHVKKLIGAQQHENPKSHKGAHTIGYSTARQAPNGMIHLITTMNRPCLHFEINEAWILQDEPIPVPTSREDTDESRRAGNEPTAPYRGHLNAAVAAPTGANTYVAEATVISGVKKYQENYPSGKVKTTWYAGIAPLQGDLNAAIAANGRYLLHGEEKWYYENSHIQREASYNLGRKVKTETYWAPDGTKLWQWHYREPLQGHLKVPAHRDAATNVAVATPTEANTNVAVAAPTGAIKCGYSRWTQYWPNGKKKAESTWRNFGPTGPFNCGYSHCDGTATLWDSSGNVISSKKFAEGKMLD
jgi:antitoxin component YwqK of YwqJK toxin-antitoxin module